MIWYILADICAIGVLQSIDWDYFFGTTCLRGAAKQGLKLSKKDKKKKEQQKVRAQREEHILNKSVLVLIQALLN